MSKELRELEKNELIDIDGGIAFIPAVVFVAKVLGGCALVGFGAGIAYELIWG